MCLLLFSYKTLPEYPLLVVANRDEFYLRKTAPLTTWQGPRGTTITAGRDLEGGGTWMGITEQGRFAALTNFRENISAEDFRSRGEVVLNMLESAGTPEAYLQSLQRKKWCYRGFNLLCGSPAALYYYSNRRPGVIEVKPGIHGMSNGFFDQSWPKVERGKDKLSQLIQHGFVGIDPLLAMLHDTKCPADEELPDTGVGIAWERILAPMFIQSSGYGTRSSAVLLFHRSGRIVFVERSYAADGCLQGERRKTLPEENRECRTRKDVYGRGELEDRR